VHGTRSQKSSLAAQLVSAVYFAMGKVRRNRKRTFMRLFSCMGLSNGGDSSLSDDDHLQQPYHQHPQQQQQQQLHQQRHSSVDSTYGFYDDSVRKRSGTETTADIVPCHGTEDPTPSDNCLERRRSVESSVVDDDVLDYVLRVKSVRHKDSMADLTRCYPHYGSTSSLSSRQPLASHSSVSVSASGRDVTLSLISALKRFSRVSNSSELSSMSALCLFDEYDDVMLTSVVNNLRGSGCDRSEEEEMTWTTDKVDLIAEVNIFHTHLPDSLVLTVSNVHA